MVADLGSEHFFAREKATQGLIRAAQAALPYLERANMEDLEVKWRVRGIRQGIMQASVPTRRLSEPLELGGAVGDVCFHPDGKHWAAAVGADAAAEVVLGKLTGTGLRVTARKGDGHSPQTVLFSHDGKTLYAGNRDGTVSVYEVP